VSENNNRRRNRALSEDERTLWKRVTETLEPLEKKRSKLVRIAIPDDPTPPTPAVAPKPVKKKSAPARPPARPARPTPPAAPPLAPLDRRMLQQLARGKVSIDGKIDLHGMTQAEAYGRLHSYLAGAQARGRKVILVITGKGGDG
jgi:DNA-nicking Smr family endonuclease